MDNIVLVSADSELCPPDIGGFLSAGIFVSGEAVRRAAADAKQQLLTNASEVLKSEIHALEVNDGRIYARATPENTVSFVELIRDSIQRHSGDSIIGKGFCKPVPEIEFYPSLSKGVGRFTDAYGFAVAVAEVEVDPETGRIKIQRIIIADDCGFSINPVNVHGQLLSQAVMGAGDALFEEIVTEEGRIINPSFADYKIPGAFDTPDFRHIPIESIEPKGPFGGKEAGECARAAVIAAIANAVANAIGVRIHSLPITPEKILVALANKGK
jgi:CO/xanthine dehydrogenase Mo-binding subunit